MVRQDDQCGTMQTIVQCGSITLFKRTMLNVKMSWLHYNTNAVEKSVCDGCSESQIWSLAPPNKLSCWCEPSWWLVLPELSEFAKLRVGRDVWAEAITWRLCFMTEQVWMIYEHVVTHVATCCKCIKGRHGYYCFWDAMQMPWRCRKFATLPANE